MLSADTILQQRYRIVRQLGQGGMGAVYEAIDQRLDTIVALKETLFSDERLRKQFEREARLLARLHHPALPRVSDHFTESDGQFLVMQYIAGEDLAAMLQARQAPFPQEDVMRWADQLCDALDYLHTQDPQIIHRDIKPQNLKLTARGQIVLLDFGLAKGSVGQMSVVTTSASIFGYTPNYAPLEQVQGLGTDARSDIYSLAATLYHLSTNVKPPDALSRAAAIVNSEADPLTPANRIAAVSGAIAAALAKGMAQNRAERFNSATEMREALRLGASEPIREASTVLIGAPAGATSPQTVTPEDRTRQAASSTRVEGSEAQTLVANDATNVRARDNEREVETVVRRPSSPPHRARTWLAAAIVLVIIGGAAAAFYAYRARQNAARQNSVTTSTSPEQPAEQNKTGIEPAQTGSTQVNSIQADPKKPTPASTEKTTRVESASERTNTVKPKNKTASEQSNVTKEAGDRPTHEAERTGERGQEQTAPQPPDTPRYDPSRNQPGHPPGTGQVPEVRTLPNGTKVIRQPDGTRIVVMPNGSTRVIPPDTKVNRRLRRNP